MNRQLSDRTQPSILFVSYGGGHSKMVIPVVQRLRATRPDLRVHYMALTSGAIDAEKADMDFLGYKDFLCDSDTAAKKWGEQLLDENWNPDSGIDRQESIAYLGLCFADLVAKYGLTEAEKIYSEKKRHAFLPTTFMNRVIHSLNVQMVVSTSSPKSEFAIVLAAKNQGIPSLSMEDLFSAKGLHHPQSDYYTVLSEISKQNLLKRQVFAKDIFVTGNPVFDKALSQRGPKNQDFLVRNFPEIQPHKKIVIFADQIGYYRTLDDLVVRSEADILETLDTIYDACRHYDAHLLLRPHPSQSKVPHLEWLQTKKESPNVTMATEQDLYALLNIADTLVSFSSTTLIESLFMKKSAIQLNYTSGPSLMPLSEMNLAWEVKQISQFSEVLGAALNDNPGNKEKQIQFAKNFPIGSATENVCHAIESVIDRHQPVRFSI